MAAIGRGWYRALGVAAVLAVAAARAGAQTTTWTATLTGPGEGPPNTSPGTGSAIVSLTGNNLSVFVTFQNLTAPTTASHIHCCAAAPGTAIVATTLPTFPDFPLGVTSGTYSHILDLTSPTSYNPAFLAANNNDVNKARDALIGGMLAGTAYLNVHSTAFPGGEIRGFLIVTPEPATLALFGSGLGVVGAMARRRRRG